MNQLIDAVIDLQDYNSKVEELVENLYAVKLGKKIDDNAGAEKVYSYSKEIPEDSKEKEFLKTWANYFLKKYSGEIYDGSYDADNNLVFNGNHYNNLVELNNGGGSNYQYLYGDISIDFDNFKKAYLSLVEDFNAKIEQPLKQLQEGLINNISINNGNKQIILFEENENGELTLKSPVYDNKELAYIIPQELKDYYSKAKEGKEYLMGIKYLNSKSSINAQQHIHLIVEVE